MKLAELEHLIRLHNAVNLAWQVSVEDGKDLHLPVPQFAYGSLSGMLGDLDIYIKETIEAG